MEHTPVLLQEVIRVLDPRPGDTYVDGTAGGGGHAAEIVRHIPGGTFLGLDWNETAANRVRERITALVAAEGLGVSVNVVQRNFSGLEEAVKEFLPGKLADCLLLDLGLSSYELDEKAGFSFREDAPLVMRYDGDITGLTAARVVNEYDEAKLARILKECGEERFAERIANGIVRARRAHPLRRTGELVAAIERAVPAGFRSAQHPALRTFLALRLYVNGELENLEKVLASLTSIMAPHGRAAVISFHSLEDRIVKRAFTAYGGAKPVRPGKEEVARNPRSRSAKLRFITIT